MLSPGQERKTRVSPRIGWVVLGLLAGGVAMVLGVRAWIFSYLSGREFQQLLSRKTSGFLGVSGEYLPLRVNGAALYSDGFRGEGSEGSLIGSISADQIRAEVYLRAVLDGEWRVEDVLMQRLELVLKPGGEIRRGPDSGREASPAASGWLPSRVVLKRAQAKEMFLTWTDSEGREGSLRNSRVEAESRGADGWKIDGQGGVLRFGAVPEMAVESLALRYREPTLFVTEAVLRQGGEGTLSVSGQIGESTELTVRFMSIPATPYLSEDWRLKVSGNLQGDVQIKAGRDRPPSGSGTLRLVSGELQALPVLDQIAEFTRTQRFRRMMLTRAEADFSSENGRTEVTRFVAESEGLLRVEGAFTIEDGQIDGAFDVGVTPASLQWLPGARDKVFTARREGYLWTPMHVSGPVAHPKEDLTARLVVAAGSAMIEGAEKEAEDAARTLLDMVTPLIP